MTVFRGRSNTENQQMSVFKNALFTISSSSLTVDVTAVSTRSTNKAQAIAEERRQRERLEKSYSQVIAEEARDQGRKSIRHAADEFLDDYRTKHRSVTYADYALRHVKSLLGDRLVVEITPKLVKGYQAARLREQAGPKTSMTK